MMSNILNSVLILSYLVVSLSPEIVSAVDHLYSFTKNRSRFRRSNVTIVSFYPVEYNSQDVDKNYSNLKDKPMYVLPEPGCSCVSTMKDFEHCYCKLGCPLAKNKDTGEKWLGEFYGDFCQNRKKFGFTSKDAPTFRQRQEQLTKRVLLSCERPDYPINGRLSFFQFICVLIDNSLSTSQYNSRPARIDLTRLPTSVRMRQTWPISQKFYSYCNVTTTTKIGDELEETDSDDRYLFLLHVNELFHLAPPPLKSPSPPPGKSPSSRETFCLSDRKVKGEQLIHKTRRVDHKMRPKQNPTDTLGNKMLFLLQKSFSIKRASYLRMSLLSRQLFCR